MTDTQPIPVYGHSGLRGVLLRPLPTTDDEPARVQLENGRVLEVDQSMLKRRDDGGYDFPLSPDDVGETVLPVLAEELDIQKRAITTGGVRVHRRIVEHEETVEMPLLKEHVDVRRLILNREVDGPLPIRKEGETTIVPIVEEVLVVSKRFVLKEEVHITRTVREELHRENVTLRRQEAEIDQLDAHGRPTVHVAPRQPRKSILGE